MNTPTSESVKPTSGASTYVGARPSIKRTHTAFTFLSPPKSEDTANSERDKLALTLEANTLYRNNAILRSAVDKIVSLCLGSNGLTVQAKTSDRSLNTIYETYFLNWTQTCDIRGRANWRQLQEYALMAKLLSGDMMFIKYDNYKLQPIEGERIKSPSGKEYKALPIIQGVQTSPLGVIEKFFVCNRDKNGNLDSRKPVEVTADKALWLTNTFRPDQIRGYGVVAPILPLLMDCASLNESTLQKAILESRMGIVTKTTTPIIANDLMPTDDATTEADPTDTKKFEYNSELNNYYLQAGAGEEVTLQTADYPSSNFEPYMRLLIQQIGAGLGIPDTILLSDFSTTRVTTSKALLQQFYETINKHQQWLIEGLIKPVWDWVIGGAIMARQLPASTEYTKIEVSRPERLLGDPLKEVTADEKEYALGVTSLTRKTRANGVDFEEILNEKKDELVMAAQKAKEANEAAGEKLFSYRDFISIGAQQTIKTDEPTKSSDQNANS